MSLMRILIVDDDPDLLFLVAHGVKTLGADYQVSTASNATIALDKVQQQRFDLIVTDYMMPEMTGLEMLHQMKDVAPETKFILMTAHHDTNQIRDDVDDLVLAGFVGKPFTMPDLLKVVNRVMADTDPASDTPPLASPEFSKEVVAEHLKNLRSQTGAHTVLLVNADGSPVHAVGNIDRDRISRLAAFVSTNFLAIFELASLFGDTDTVFKSSYYEGNKYNIYAYNINGDYFLAVVFGAGGKPGTVWFYAKQIATELASVLPNSENSLSQDESITLAKDFETLLGNDAGGNNH